MVKTKNLIPNLNHKRKHKFHNQNLKLYLTLGLQFNKNHRIIEFKQEPFLKPHINCNTDLRREAERKVAESKNKILN